MFKDYDDVANCKIVRATLILRFPINLRQDFVNVLNKN